MLKIGDFSNLSRISIRMLRYYDEIGLLHPVKVDPFTGYRYYSEEQLVTAGRINRLRGMGFGLAAAAKLLEQYNDAEKLEASLLTQRRELIKQRDSITRKIQLLDTALSGLRKEDNMNYKVELKTIPERKCACVRDIIPDYDQEGMLWSTLMSETAPLQIPDTEDCICCAVFHDDEYKEADVDVEVQKSVHGQWPDTEHVKFRTVPAVEVAACVHRGSYAGIGAAMTEVAAWMEKNGYILSGPAFYIYHVSPHETSNPDAFVTEICYPVKKV